MESILTSIKKMLGIAEDYEHFDTDLVMHINSVFTVLNQIGVGPLKGFMISDKSAKWSDFLADDSQYELVKSFMYLKVKLLFDPPLSSSVIESMNRMISEFEWRLQVAADSWASANDLSELDVANDEEIHDMLTDVFGKEFSGSNIANDREIYDMLDDVFSV